MKEELDKQV